MRKLKIALVCLSLLFLSGCTHHGSSNTTDIITLQLWHYYSGSQLSSFNRLIDQFNATVGKEKGIIIESSSLGSVSKLSDSVIDAAKHEVGSKKVPDLFAAYSDTVYQADQLGIVASLNQYFTQDELDKYIKSYVEEGYLGSDELKIFPIAKATEVLMINMTDFEPFSLATGITLESLSTIEGVTEAAKAYYEYSNGKAFFGRDAMANYMIIGLKQLGHDILSENNGVVEIDFDKEAVKKLWDNYYIPYIKGHFYSEGRFRSDDVKLGNIIACVSSSSGTTFFPDKVVMSDEEIYPINVAVLAAPSFQDSQPYIVQQGAGMVVTKNTLERERAAVEFLKWFTQLEQNAVFSIESGYLPVTKEANSVEVIEDLVTIEDELVQKVIETSIETVNKNYPYTTPANESGEDIRNILEDSLETQAKKDREMIEQSNLNNIEQYLSNEYFEQWYNDVYQQLVGVLQ